MRKLLANKKVKASLIIVAMTTHIVGTIAYGNQVSNEVSFKVGEATYVVNGEEKVMDSEAIVHGSRTMVPMKYAAEAFGAKVEWDKDTRTVVITHGEKVIKLPIDANIIYVGEEKIEMDTKAVVVEGRTMLPLAYIAQSLGLVTSWDGETKTVKITESMEVIKQKEIEKKLESITYTDNSVSRVFDINEMYLANDEEEGLVKVDIGMSKASANIKAIVRAKGEKPPTAAEILENPNYGIIKEGRLSGFLLFPNVELLNIKEGKNVIYLLSYDINGVEGDIDNIVAHEFDYPIKD
ncbi:copper amine oxidase N-terminal domain-containing protein [Acetoanaerobium noterae]|uniref:copper amine oxidase N-terminal domain-containing protein n=1 Tax=Acetoanaerobium noterae TaxID=745369 RepID=UPI0032220B85